MNLNLHVHRGARHARFSSDQVARTGALIRRAASVSLSLLLVASAWAQSTASAPAYVPRYDKNGNGRLDPEEVAAMQADQTRAASAPAAATAAAGETPGEIVTLSPFEVVDNNRGYYAANTMSGTRINSKLEDLASSITVVTKEQMADFAMLDINDVFAYEAGTEGSATYPDFSFNQSAQPNDNLAADPNTANRVRGLSSANIAYGGFETSRRVPLDPISSDAVEISRGPNSNLFGLGNASGTAHTVPATANLSRNKSQLQLRLEQYGRLDGEMGYRQSLDVNRVLVKDKLAVRFSEVFQQTEFNRQPSGVKTERYNAMVKYRPFRNTTISGTYQYFHSYGRRPNSITPRDAVSQWVAVGSPTWDATTNTAYINGSPVTRGGAPTTQLGQGVPNISRYSSGLSRA